MECEAADALLREAPRSVADSPSLPSSTLKLWDYSKGKVSGWVAGPPGGWVVAEPTQSRPHWAGLEQVSLAGDFADGQSAG